MKRATWLLLALVAACHLPSPVPPVTDADATAPDPVDADLEASRRPVSDAGPPDVGPNATDCERACAVLGPQFLGCPEGNSTPRGETCAETCQNAKDFGIKLNTAAIIKCKDIDCARRAGVKCGKK